MRWEPVIRVERIPVRIDRQINIWFGGPCRILYFFAAYPLRVCFFCLHLPAERKRGIMNTKGNKQLIRMIFLAMMVAVGVVISPILRVEGMCPMQHFINVTVAVLLGPVDAFICACLIGIIRMVTMGITPMALTGAVFGAFLSGLLYRLSRGKLIAAVIGEIIGTGIIGAIVSYPVMTYLWGRTGLTWLFYVPSFTAGTIIGGSLAFIFLRQLQRTKLLGTIQQNLGSMSYANGSDVANDAIGICMLGFILYLASVVLVKAFIPEPTGFVTYIKYIVLALCLIAGGLYYLINKKKAA